MSDLVSFTKSLLLLWIFNRSIQVFLLTVNSKIKSQEPERKEPANRQIKTCNRNLRVDLNDSLISEEVGYFIGRLKGAAIY
jgi:hypothetical protein